MSEQTQNELRRKREREELRDWFAGQALAGLVGGCAGRLGNEFSAYATGPCNAALAERAYSLADAMLAQRSKQEGK